MSHQDLGFVALGRFLAVERYCQSSQPSADPARRPRPDRTAGRAGKPAASRAPRAPALPEHG